MLWFRIEQRETGKEYSEFCVLCTHSIIIYNEEDIQEQGTKLSFSGKYLVTYVPVKSYHISLLNVIKSYS